MTINIIDDSEHALNLEEFVIKIFDGIKCADGTDNQFRLYLSKHEVRYFARLIRDISAFEIKSDVQPYEALPFE